MGFGGRFGVERWIASQNIKLFSALIRGTNPLKLRRTKILNRLLLDEKKKLLNLSARSKKKISA